VAHPRLQSGSCVDLAAMSSRVSLRMPSSCFAFLLHLVSCTQNDDKVQSRRERSWRESTVEKSLQSRREHGRGESGDSAVEEIERLRRERERGGSVELE
jgi:hypothetical protein